MLEGEKLKYVIELNKMALYMPLVIVGHKHATGVTILAIYSITCYYKILLCSII